MKKTEGDPWELIFERGPLDTPSDLAEYLNTTPQTVLAWYHAGKIPALVSCGRIIRFDRKQVLEALGSRKEGA